MTLASGFKRRTPILRQQRLTETDLRKETDWTSSLFDSADISLSHFGSGDAVGPSGSGPAESHEHATDLPQRGCIDVE